GCPTGGTTRRCRESDGRTERNGQTMKNRQWRVFAFREVDMSPTAASEMPSPIRNDALFQNSPHLSQYSRWIQWVSWHRAILSEELRRNNTLDICHLSGL